MIGRSLKLYRSLTFYVRTPNCIFSPLVDANTQTGFFSRQLA
jgi:hypothetical protein